MSTVLRADEVRAPAPVPRPRRPSRRPTGLRAGVFGLGAALPSQVVTNRDLERVLDTDDAWIQRRTGIRERRRLAPGEPLAPLAAAACAEALADAGREAAEVDQVIVTTITPDRITPGWPRRSPASWGPTTPAPSTSTPPARDSSTRSTRPPRSSRAAAPASCSCARPRR